MMTDPANITRRSWIGFEAGAGLTKQYQRMIGHRPSSQAVFGNLAIDCHGMVLPGYSIRNVGAFGDIFCDIIWQ